MPSGDACEGVAAPDGVSACGHRAGRSPGRPRRDAKPIAGPDALAAKAIGLLQRLDTDAMSSSDLGEGVARAHDVGAALGVGSGWAHRERQRKNDKNERQNELLHRGRRCMLQGLDASAGPRLDRTADARDARPVRIVALLSMSLLLATPAAAQDASGGDERTSDVESVEAGASGRDAEAHARVEEGSDPADDEGQERLDAPGTEPTERSVEESSSEPADSSPDPESGEPEEERAETESRGATVETFGWSEEKTIGWVTFGSSLAVAIAGGILLAAGVDDVSSIENAPDGTLWHTVAGARDRAPIFTGTGAVLLGLGAAGAAVGAGLLAAFGRDGTWLSVSVLPGEVRVGGRF